MADRITYIGLDVHTEGIVVAVAAGGLRGEFREYGRIEGWQIRGPPVVDRGGLELPLPSPGSAASCCGRRTSPS
jgi:hypothetical protein